VISVKFLMLIVLISLLQMHTQIGIRTHKQCITYVTKVSFLIKFCSFELSIYQRIQRKNVSWFPHKY